MVAIRKLVRTFFILGPKFNAMDAELVALIELGEEPTGNIRITATEHSAFRCQPAGSHAGVGATGSPRPVDGIDYPIRGMAEHGAWVVLARRDGACEPGRCIRSQHCRTRRSRLH